MSKDDTGPRINTKDGYSIRPGEVPLLKGYAPISSGPAAPMPTSIPNPGPTVQPPPPPPAAKGKAD